MNFFAPLVITTNLIVCIIIIVNIYFAEDFHGIWDSLIFDSDVKAQVNVKYVVVQFYSCLQSCYHTLCNHSQKQKENETLNQGMFSDH